MSNMATSNNITLSGNTAGCTVIPGATLAPLTIGAVGSGGYTYTTNQTGVWGTNQYGNFNLSDTLNTLSRRNLINTMLENSELTFSIVKANGGYVVRCAASNSQAELYIIPDDKKNFDRELGKIISMHLLKQPS